MHFKIGVLMGQLKKIINDINGPSFAKEIQDKLPLHIRENIESFYPENLDYDLIIKNYHQDKRQLFTSGSFVPIPYMLTILPIFTGGKESDCKFTNNKTLTLSGSKHGHLNVESMGVSSDLCFYVFCFLLQMSIFRKTSLLYIDLPYLCEFLGWKCNYATKQKISIILEKLASIKFDGNYFGTFKNCKKKENLMNVFSGEFIKAYYIDIEQDILITNFSESILNLFAMDKVWYGIDLFKYSKIPTGHAKTLALYIGGKARGLNSIDISSNEILERLAIKNLKSDKQKNKIIKDSLTILLNNNIIFNFSFSGKGSRRIITILFNKDNYFCFAKNTNERSINSLKCHSTHVDKEENINLKSIYLKVIKIHELNNLGIKNNNGLNRIKNDVSNQNFNFNQIKIKKTSLPYKEFMNNNGFENFKNKISLFLNQQAEYYNKNEEMFTNILNGQIDSISILAESLNETIESSIVNNDLKKKLQIKLFDFIDNNSINIGSAVKKSKIPYIKLSNGNIKLKRFNNENYNELKGLEKISMTNILLNKDSYSSDIYNQGLISEYDYSKLKSSNKPLIKNKEDLTNSILFEGTNTFWFVSEHHDINNFQLSSQLTLDNSIEKIKKFKNNNHQIIEELVKNDDFFNIVEDINENEIILKGKIPIYDNEKRVEILTVYDFKKYIKENALILSEKNINNKNTLILLKTSKELSKKITLIADKDFCDYMDLDYKKEYRNLRDQYLNNIQNDSNSSYTLNESKKLKIINQVRDMHLKNIPDFGFIELNKKESEIDFNELFDTEHLFDSIEFENIPDRI